MNSRYFVYYEYDFTRLIYIDIWNFLNTRNACANINFANDKHTDSAATSPKSVI